MEKDWSRERSRQEERDKDVFVRDCEWEGESVGRHVRNYVCSNTALMLCVFACLSLLRKSGVKKFTPTWWLPHGSGSFHTAGSCRGTRMGNARTGGPAETHADSSLAQTHCTQTDWAGRQERSVTLKCLILDTQKPTAFGFANLKPVLIFIFGLFLEPCRWLTFGLIFGISTWLASTDKRLFVWSWAMMHLKWPYISKQCYF